MYYEYFERKYITYWFFYAYNDGWGTIDHEGDWESIVVRLGDDNRPTHVAYNRHGCRAIVRWENVLKTGWNGRLKRNGTHPLVYSTRGTHGSYAFARPSIRQVCGAPSGVYDSLGAGPTWRTWSVMFNARNQSWYGFGGAWGEVGELGETTGPMGPSFYKSAAPPEWW